MRQIKAIVILSICAMSLACEGSRDVVQKAPSAQSAPAVSPANAGEVDPSLPADALITLERTGHRRGCPQYSLRVYSDGSIQFDGVANVSAIGPRHASITKENVKFLFRVAGYVGFDKLDDAYVENVSDVWTTTISTQRNGVRHQVVNRWAPFISFDEEAPNEKQHLMLDYFATTIETLALDPQWIGERSMEEEQDH